MAPKEFDWEEQEEVRGQMPEAGYGLIRRYGTTHISVEKVTTAIGLDRSTFYNFFPNKERFVYEMMGYLRTQFMGYLQQLLDGRGKLPIPQVKEFLKKIIFSEQSTYQYLTAEDKERLRAALPPECFFNAQYESQAMMRLFGRTGGVCVNLGEHSVANLLKIMVLVQINQTQLHADTLERTLQPMYELLFSCIFTEESQTTPSFAYVLYKTSKGRGPVMRMDTYGLKEKPCILLLHITSTTGTLSEALIPALVQDYFLVTPAPDGYDPDEKAGYPGIDEELKRIETYLKGKQVGEPAAAAGSSLGAILTWRLQQCHRIPIHRLMLDSPSSGWGTVQAAENTESF